MNILRFDSNERGRDFVVGDMHGQLAMFRRLLDIAKFNPVCDRIFSVGDLIDRGPDSPGCLELLAEPWFFAVRGNHEDMLIRTVRGNAPALWMMNGGRWWRSVPDASRERYAQLCEALPLVIVVGDGPARFNVLHAEFLFDGSDLRLDSGDFSRDDIRMILWGRDNIGGFCEETPGLSITYVGHTPVDTIRRIGSHVYVDTGASFPDGNLTMIEPLTGATFSTPREVAP